MCEEDDDPDAPAALVVNGVPVRQRRQPDPVYTAICAGCSTPFWFKKNHGSVGYNGTKHQSRVACPWCNRGNYVDCDHEGKPTHDKAG